MNWNDALRRVLAEIDANIDAVVAPMRGVSRPVITPYRGYGTSSRAWVQGRVLDDPQTDTPLEGQQRFGHTREMWRRFASEEIAGAKVEISVGASTVETETGPEGYFEVEVDTDLDSDSMWHPWRARLPSAPAEKDRRWYEGMILVPPSSSRVGIISDIDDTIIDSSATDRLQMLRTLLFTPSSARIPFEGIAELFHALLSSDQRLNPVFYVSSSPWNLYDFLIEVLDTHDLPQGPLILQDYGFDDDKLIHAPHDDHKLKQISRIIATYPELEWLLVGDSGQRDPEIYHAIAEAFPELVKTIIIRDVTTDRRDAEVRSILGPLGSRGISVALVRTADEVRQLLEKAHYLAAPRDRLPR